jgi:DNA-binding MarR family transcriptional regulator
MSSRRKKLDLDRIVETIIYLQTEGRRVAKEQAERLGVTATQLNVLKFLHQLGDLSLSELSRAIAARNSTVTGIVDRMEEAGLVAREQSATDRRVWKIRLAKRGAEIAVRAEVPSWDLLQHALEALSEDDKQTLVRILDQVARHVMKEEKNG